MKEPSQAAVNYEAEQHLKRKAFAVAYDKLCTEHGYHITQGAIYSQEMVLGKDRVSEYLASLLSEARGE